MKYTIDTDHNRIGVVDNDGSHTELELYSPAGADVLTRMWLAVGWTQRHSYRFTWAGRPIIQLPHDVLRYQEVLWRLRPDVIVETGIAHGGSLLFAASLCALIGNGRVVGVDIDIRAANRAAIEMHPLGASITLVEGDSADPNVARRVADAIQPHESVLVLLDSNHTKAHVAAELRAYAPLVSVGSYLIVADGVMRDFSTLPGGGPDWHWNNPYAAASEFLATHPEFRAEDPPPPFDESSGGEQPTYWPRGYLKRIT